MTTLINNNNNNDSSNIQLPLIIINKILKEAFRLSIFENKNLIEYNKKWCLSIRLISHYHIKLFKQFNTILYLNEKVVSGKNLDQLLDLFYERVEIIDFNFNQRNLGLDKIGNEMLENSLTTLYKCTNTDLLYLNERFNTSTALASLTSIGLCLIKEIPDNLLTLIPNLRHLKLIYPRYYRHNFEQSLLQLFSQRFPELKSFTINRYDTYGVQIYFIDVCKPLFDGLKHSMPNIEYLHVNTSDNSVILHDQDTNLYIISYLQLNPQMKYFAYIMNAVSTQINHYLLSDDNCQIQEISIDMFITHPVKINRQIEKLHVTLLVDENDDLNQPTTQSQNENQQQQHHHHYHDQHDNQQPPQQQAQQNEFIISSESNTEIQIIAPKIQEEIDYSAFNNIEHLVFFVSHQESFTYVANIINANTQTKTIKIVMNEDPEEESVNALSEAIRNNKSLIYIDLDASNISIETVSPIIEIIKSHPILLNKYK